ncbi:hypothetical protein VPHD81_0097 [Vibrio phage D81]
MIDYVLFLAAYLVIMVLGRMVGRIAFVSATNAYRAYKINQVCDDDTCCCGAPMEGHSFYDNHSPRSMKDYALSCSLVKY